MPALQNTAWRAWVSGWRRVLAAPAVAGSVLGLTILLTLPLATVLRQDLRTHLGDSLTADRLADGVDYDWWQEFRAQATGVSTTFSPTIIGFAATLDNVSSVLDGQPEMFQVASLLALYLTVWLFLSGGILDRYARQRPTHAHGFFAAGGVFFLRFLRLTALAGIVYWWLFSYVRPWLLDDWYTALTRDVGSERTVFFWRLAFYGLFGTLLLLTNIVFDYAKVRLVVEDRRSAIGALNAAMRFLVRRPGRAIGLYVLNSLVFLAVLALWALIAPGVTDAGAAMWIAFGMGQAYIVTRLLLKLQFLASQTALFQASLAHAAYTAAPSLPWPESAAAETITGTTD